MANKHGDFVWYELMTTDVDAAQAFYGPLLGWRFSSSEEDDPNYRTFSMNGHDIGGFLPLSNSGTMPLWVGYISVDSVESAVTTIRSAGGVIHMAPKSIPGVGRFAFVSDPQGGVFYILECERDDISVAFAADVPMPGHCAWNELVTTDQTAAMAFYCDRFGWEKDGDMDMGPLGTYEFLRHGSLIGAMMTAPSEVTAAGWTHYFRVPDIDAAIATVAANGGQVLNGPMEIPGGEYTINATDPQGAMFALVGVRPSN